MLNPPHVNHQDILTGGQEHHLHQEQESGLETVKNVMVIILHRGSSAGVGLGVLQETKETETLETEIDMVAIKMTGE